MIYLWMIPNWTQVYPFFDTDIFVQAILTGLEYLYDGKANKLTISENTICFHSIQRYHK